MSDRWKVGILGAALGFVVFGPAGAAIGAGIAVKRYDHYKRVAANDNFRREVEVTDYKVSNDDDEPDYSSAV